MAVVKGEILEDLPGRQRMLGQDGEHTGVLTGFGRIDKITGGLWKGELSLVFGLTGVGKSTLLLNFVHAAVLAGKSVMYVTTEMPKRQVQLRYDSLASGIPYRKFKRGKLTKKHKEKWRKRLLGASKGRGRLFGFTRSAYRMLCRASQGPSR